MDQFKDAIEFFNTVYGIYCRMRELHFNTHIQAEHDLTNDLMPALLDYTDSVMENQMGILDSRPGMDILEMVKCNCTTITATLQELSSKIKSYRDTLDETTQIGIINILDDFAQDVNKWIYLSRNK